MVSTIRLYPFPDIAKGFLDKERETIKKIESDTHTTIKYVKKRFDSFFVIEGKFEDVHQARIIMQDIEKNVYRILHLEHTP